MPERGLNLQDIQWRELFLFTRIFRAFRVAIRPSKILLALVALILMYCGGRALDWIWPQEQVDQGYELRMGYKPVVAVPKPFAAFIETEVVSFHQITADVVDMRWGYPSGVPSTIAKFAVQTPVSFWRGNQFYFTLLYAWFLLVWAVFGGAICRIAAIHIARDEVISPWRALRFSLRALPSFIAAPLIPFILIICFGFLISLLGLLVYIPYAGPILAGLLLVIPLMLALLMTVLVIGSIAGSGLMYPTIAVEGSDAFDAVSRALSHVFAAPWRLLFYSAVAIIYGTLTYFFVRVCAFLVLVMMNFFMGWLLWGGAQDRWANMWPGPSFERLAQAPNWGDLPTWADRTGAGITSFWVYLVIATVGAFLISFYFSASTIIYLLMRRKVDATELDAVYLEPSDEQLPEGTGTEPGKAAEGGASEVNPPTAPGNA